jgi:hypothetical protein
LQFVSDIPLLFWPWQTLKWMPERKNTNPEALVFEGLVYDGNVIIETAARP